MDFDKVVESRHSVRSFKETKEPNYRRVIEAIESATKAPLAGNLPSLKYIMVSNREKIKELAQAAQQDFIAKACYIVVVCSDKRFLEKYYYERAEMYARQQAGAAIENFLLKITDIGLGSCWIGAFSEGTVKRILNIPDNINVEALLPVGYAAFEEQANYKKQPKPEMNSLLFFDKYNNKYMKPINMPYLR